MRTKENKTKTIQVRLTEREYEYLKQAAFALGTDASKLVRQIVQMSINAAKQAEMMKTERNQPINDSGLESEVIISENN